MNRRLFRPLIFVLVVAQGLAFIPAATAVAASHSSSRTEMPCADQMSGVGHAKPYRCCPDCVGTMAACLSACTASTAPLSAFSVPVADASSEPVFTAVRIAAGDWSDPPLKPPPIV